jgi:hypothetical protein
MLGCMRTTVTIDDDLLRQARVVAATSGRTLAEVIKDALRGTFAARRTPQTQLRPLPTFKGTGVAPGVDLSDNAATRAFELEWEIKDRPEKYPWLTGRDPS